MDSNRKPKSNRSGSTATTTRTTTMTIVEAAAAAVATEEESNEGDQHQQWIESSSSCSSSSWSAAAASKKKWKCAQCTYENWPSSMRCVICLCDKNASLTTTPNMYSSTSSLSSCQATGCSSTTSGGGSSNQKKKIIPATVQQSVMTGGGGSPKDTAKTVELVAHDHLGKWSCPQCTYLNWPKSPKCAACYTPRVSFSSSSSSSNNSTSEQHNHHNHHSNDLASTNSGNNSVNNNNNNGNVEPSLLKTVCQQQQHQKSGGQKSSTNSPKNSPLNRSLCNSPVPPTTSATPPPQQPLNTTAATTTPTTTVNATVVSKPQTPEPHITHINQSSECITTTTTTHHTDPTVELIPTNQQTISISTSSKQQLSSTTSDQALKKWSCSACTYQNWPKSQRCVMCLVPRHAQLTPMTTSTTTNQPSNRVMINLKEQKLQQQQQQQQQQQMVMMSSLQIHMDRLFLAACEGVVDGDMAPINRYLGAGGDLTRYLTSDECKMLNRPNIFKVGLTLLHLCYQFKRKEFLIKLLNQKSHVSNLTLQQQQHYQAKVINTLIKQINSAKFSPCQSCPSLASNIVDRYFSACLRQRKTPSSLTQRFMLQQQLNPESSALFNSNNNACCSSSVCSGGGEGISPSSSLISLNNSHHQQHYSSKKKQHHNHHHFHHHHSPSPSPPPSSSAAAASSLFGAAAAVGGAAAAATAAASNDVACFYVNESHTFTLPSEIEDFAPKIQSILFDELLDREVQQELEYECRVINWNLDICKRLSSRLYPLWNRHSGDCLLDSVLQACYGVFDTDNILRRVMADTLEQFACYLKPRWKEHEILMARSLDYHIDDYQLEQDWSNIISLANQPGASLEQAHIFALAHIFRRPIIVYSVKYVKSFRGENIGFTHFEGVYLPLIWEPSFCFKSPIALGYTRGHFTALVPLDRPDIYTYVFPPQSTTSAGSTSTSTCEAAASSSVGGACGGGGSSGSDSFSSSSFSSSPSAAQLPTSSSSVMMTSPADENLNLLNGGAMAIGTGTNQAVVTTSTTGNSNSSVSNENSEKTSGGGAATTTTTTNQLGAVSSEYGSGCEPSSSQQVFYLPLTNNEGQLLPVHFLTHQELGRERTILRQYLNLDCLVMQGNCSLLAAQQRVVKRGMLVKQMLDEWLSYYRNMQAKEMGKQIEVIHEQNSEDQLVIENNNNDYEDDDDDDEDDDEDEEEEEDDDDEEQDEEDYEEEEDEEEDDDDEDDDVEDDEYCEKVNVQ